MTKGQNAPKLCRRDSQTNRLTVSQFLNATTYICCGGGGRECVGEHKNYPFFWLVNVFVRLIMQSSTGSQAWLQHTRKIHRAQTSRCQSLTLKKVTINVTVIPLYDTTNYKLHRIVRKRANAISHLLWKITWPCKRSFWKSRSQTMVRTVTRTTMHSDTLKHTLVLDKSIPRNTCNTRWKKTLRTHNRQLRNAP